MDWIKSFGLKIWDKIKDHLASYIARYILLLVGVIFLIICFFLRKWAFTKYSLEIYVWTWLSILFVFLFLFVFFLRSTLYKVRRLKNPRDIINAINNWFTRHIDGAAPIVQNQPYYFADVEKDLHYLKRGKSKIYLPMVALKHGYCFEAGKKTFKLSKLTLNNDPTNVLEKYLKPLLNGEKEIILPCSDIDIELIWPEGATKSFLLSRPLKNVEFGIEIEDIGGDKIRIIRKE